MRCAICGHDVPLTSHADGSHALACKHCGTTIYGAAGKRRLDPSHRRQGTSFEVDGLTSLGERPPVISDPLGASAWESSRMGAPRERTPALDDASLHRHDDAHASLVKSSKAPRRVRRASTWFSWLMLMLGVTLFSAGATLIGLSFHDNNQQLWNVGTPLALAGQGAFLIGVILQLDILWHQGRATSRTLRQIDERLHQSESPLLGPRERPQVNEPPVANATRGETAHSDRYLSDLRRQIDLLSHKLSQPRV